MKKNIFDKILICVSIIIILLNWLFCNIVLAESTNENLEDISVAEGNVGEETYSELRKKLVEELRSKLEEAYSYSGTVEELADLCGIDLNDTTAGEVTSSEGKIIKIDDNTTIVLGFEMKCETGSKSQYITDDNTDGRYTEMKISNIKVVKNTGADNTTKKNEEAKSSSFINFTNEMIVGGKTYSGDTNWDIGGVLLKPFFFLVNCVADTLLGIIQKFMYSDVTDQDQITNYVKTNYIDKCRVVDSRNIDTMFDLSLNNQILCYLGSKGKISNVEYPHIHYSPEEIFAGKISLLNIDFISGVGQAEGLGVVRQALANWYKALRLIATVGFLSVLIYIGIKIMLSANTKNRAKYKELIIDWIVGLAILYSMHYIMSFIITAINMFNDKLGASMPLLRVVGGNGYDTFATNLIGLVRFCTEYDTIAVKIGYEIMYIMLVGYTIKFTVIYLKRVLNIAFLTLIAPIVAFTYPIDKSIDGKAQGFSMWIKEYFFNALIQPVHYLLYYVMVSSAMGIAVKNPLYAIAVLTFLTEAERLLKKIFGFDKAREGMVGGLGAVSMVSAANGVKKLVGKKGNGANSSKAIGYPGALNKDYKTAELLNDSIQTTQSPTSADDDRENIDDDENNNGPIGDNTNHRLSNNNNIQDQDIEEPIGRPKLLGDIIPRSELPANKKPIKQLMRSMHEKRKDLTAQALETPVGQTMSNIANSRGGRVAMRIGSGIGAIGKRAIRPIYDVNRTAKYNGKRFVRNIAKGAVGAGIGITAAAVQAGISLTDGHYKPTEALASFSVGYAYGTKKTDNIIDTFGTGYVEGYDKNEKMEVYKENFKNRDDVIQFCKEKYGNEWREYRDRIVDNYVTRGFIDLDEIKQCITYSNAVAKEEVEENPETVNLTGRAKEKAIDKERDKQDVIAMSILTHKKKRKKQNISSITYNPKREKQYLDSITKGMDTEKAEKTRKEEKAVSASIRYFDSKTT